MTEPAGKLVNAPNSEGNVESELKTIKREVKARTKSSSASELKIHEEILKLQDRIDQVCIPKNLKARLVEMMYQLRSAQEEYNGALEKYICDLNELVNEPAIWL